MIVLCTLLFHPTLGISPPLPQKGAGKIRQIISNSVTLCQFVLKFDMLVHYGTFKVNELLKSAFDQIQDGIYYRRPQIFNISIAKTQPLKFGTEFDRVTADTLPLYCQSVKGHGHIVIAYRSPNFPYHIGNRGP